MTQLVLESIWFKQSLSPEVQEILSDCSCRVDDAAKEITLVTDRPKFVTRNFEQLDQELKSLGFQKLYLYKGEELYCSVSIGLFQDKNVRVLAS